MKVPLFFEGIPGEDNFSDGNEEKHNCTDDQGVEKEDASSLARTRAFGS